MALKSIICGALRLLGMHELDCARCCVVDEYEGGACANAFGNSAVSPAKPSRRNPVRLRATKQPRD